MSESYLVCEDCRRSTGMNCGKHGPTVFIEGGSTLPLLAERQYAYDRIATLIAERDAALAERDAALDMVAEVGQPLAALSMPQIHRNADVVKALRQREIAAKETVKCLGDGIMRCIDASWSGARSLDWTHPELILAEYVDAALAERDAAQEEVSRIQDRADGYRAEIDILLHGRAEHVAYIETLAAALTEARRVLREVEWDHNGVCPLCGGLRGGDTHVYHASHVEVVRGHFPDCALAAVLAQEETL